MPACRHRVATMPKRAGISFGSINRAPLIRRTNRGETLRTNIKVIAPSAVVITAPDVPA